MFLHIIMRMRIGRGEAEAVVYIYNGRAYGRLLVDTTVKSFSKATKNVAIRKAIILPNKMRVTHFARQKLFIVERSDIRPVG